MWRCTCGTDVPNGCSHSCGGSFIPSKPSPYPWEPPGIPIPQQAVVASLQRQVDGLARECARLQDKADQWDAAQPMIEAMQGVVMAAQEAQRFADNEKHYRHAWEEREPGNCGDQAIALSNAILFREVADRILKSALGKISMPASEIPQKGSDD